MVSQAHSDAFAEMCELAWRQVTERSSRSNCWFGAPVTGRLADSRRTFLLHRCIEFIQRPARYRSQHADKRLGTITQQRNALLIQISR